MISDQEKVEVYERLFHRLQLYREVTLNKVKVERLLDAIGGWSYAHRAGNGELSDEEQQARIDACFENIKKLIQ